MITGADWGWCNRHFLMKKKRDPTDIQESPSRRRRRDAPAPKEMGGASASGLIDARIKELGDWRGQTLARVRMLIRRADPDVVEEVKWRKPSNPGGVPVWSHDGIVCTGETYKNVVKITFAKGAALA